MDHCEVSIIIVNYNTLVLLRECIQSIVCQTHGITTEIIVVDNASTENPRELLAAEFPEVQFLLSTVNLGFGQANNLGASHASGKYLFFLNSDTLLLNNAVRILCDYMECHPTVGICGANLYDAAGNPNISYFSFPTFREELRIFLLPKYSQNIQGKHNFTGEPLQVDCISGADLMIHAELFRLLNGFSSDFFMYYEETELTLRLSKMQFEVYSVPEARILHYQGMSLSKNRRSLNTGMFLSKFIYFRKTKGPVYPWLIKTIHLAKCSIALLLFALRKDKTEYWKDKRDKIKMVYRQYNSHFSARDTLHL